MVPHRRSTSALSAPRFFGSGSLSELGDAHPRAALPGDDPDPAAGAPGQGRVKPGEPVIQPLPEPVGELGGVQGLAQLGVVDVAVVLEVARQVLVRVLPAARALDVDLAAAQRVPQRDQHAQLVRDALHPAVVVGDAVQPRLRHHPVDRHLLPGRVELLVAVGARVAGEQADGVHDRPVGAVVAAELQRGQQRGEHPPVVVRVGAAQLVADPLGHRPLGRLQLPGQRAQRLHPARHHRVHRLPHRVVGVLEGGVDHPGEDAALARHVRQLADQFLLHPPLGTGVDPVDQPGQQLHQAVDKLGLPRPAQRRQQRVPHRLPAVLEVRGVHAGRPRPPRRHDPVRRAGEHRLVQPERPHRRQLADLGQQRVQPQRPRVGLQLGQHVRPRQQLFQPGARHGPEPPGGRRGEGVVELPAARGDHALHLASARRLHLLAAAAPPQRGRQAVPVRLGRAYLLGQPLRPALLVVLGRRPRPVDLADLGPVVLDRPARPGVPGEQRRGRPSPATRDT